MISMMEMMSTMEMMNAMEKMHLLRLCHRLVTMPCNMIILSKHLKLVICGLWHQQDSTRCARAQPGPIYNGPMHLYYCINK